jgi:pimeloyl-ACP methyl ester carboxylesterase
VRPDLLSKRIGLIAMMEAAANFNVRRRRVLYVPGYDPRGWAFYYRLFRTESRLFSKLHSIDVTISKAEHSDSRHSVCWSLRAAAGGWSVDTVYEFLCWEDLIRCDFTRPRWRTALAALAVAVAMLIDGSFGKIAHASWRYACTFVYSGAVIVAYIMIACGIGLYIPLIIAPSTLYFPLAHLVAFAAGTLIVMFLSRRLEPCLNIFWLLNYLIFVDRFAHRRISAVEQRLQLFANYLVDAAANSNVDEIIVIGHSSGSFLAVDVLARAIALDPNLGEHGPRVAALTVGSEFPIVGFRPSAQWFRDRIERLGIERTVDWVDCQSRQDFMNFFRFDPIIGHGIDLGGRRVNPVVVEVHFRDAINPLWYRQFKWHVFRVHFQFIMANQKLAPYDFFMIVCGPVRLRIWSEQPKKVITAIVQEIRAGVAAKARED